MPTSDVRVIDIDGDGMLEYMTLLHSMEKICMYSKKLIKLEQIYHRSNHAILHALWAGELNGVPTFLVGNRHGDRDLLLYVMTMKKKSFFYTNRS